MGARAHEHNTVKNLVRYPLFSVRTIFVANEQGTLIARLLHGYYHFRLFRWNLISGDLFLSIDRIRDNAKSHNTCFSMS
jgi:hypothetical protein